MIRSFALLLIASLAISNGYAKDANAFSSTQILAHDIKGGHSWTLTTRLGYFLQKAEKEFGLRDKSWTILGVEFALNGPPNIWYPFSSRKNVNGKPSKFVAVQLTKSSANDKKKALFQLAHETIHLLSPNGPKHKSRVLEEGLATYFSIHALADTGVEINAQYIASKTYTQAYTLVSQLYTLHPDAGARFKALRAKGHTFSDINKQQLMQSFPKLDDKLASLLTQRFD
jgi:hypothetical protein